MKTEADVKEGLMLLRAYMEGGANKRLSRETASNLWGVVAAMEWFLDIKPQETNPVKQTLDDLRKAGVA